MSFSNPVLILPPRFRRRDDMGRDKGGQFQAS
jgi:hypothetical protein